MQYEDFILQLGAYPHGRYYIRVVQSPAGQGRVLPQSPFTTSELGLLASTAAPRSVRDVLPPAGIQQLSAEAIGDRLFQKVFAGPVRDLFVASLAMVKSNGRGLRLQLRIDLPELARLQDLPWELLYHAEHDEFLCLSQDTAVVRALEVPRPERPFSISGRLRILAAVANTHEPGAQQLDVEKEISQLEQIAKQEDIVLEIQTDIRLESLAQALAKGSFHILHFLGHGWFDVRTGQGGLCFQAPGGGTERVDGRALALELKSCHDLQLVVLNACATARVGGGGRQAAFAGAASALILGGGFPAVVAMRAPISDRAAIAFSQTFFRQLLAGDPIEEAMRQGRVTLHRLPGLEPAEWSIPVLFLHGRSADTSRQLSPVAAPRPRLARQLLDRTFPRLHQALTLQGTFAEPPELPDVQGYLVKLRTQLEHGLSEKTYVPLHARTVPAGTFGGDLALDPFTRRIHKKIRSLLTPQQDAYFASVQNAAYQGRSRTVRNLIHPLLRGREPILLLGDPGSGKTMTLQETALALLEAESERIFPLIPIFVNLGDFHVAGRATSEHVGDLVRRAAKAPLRPWLEHLEKTNRLVLFFDGMDEMSRDRYGEHCAALSHYAGERRGRVRTLFTCRVNDFSPTFRARCLALAPLARPQILAYLRRCLQVPALGIDGEVWNLPQLAQRLTAEDLPVDARNPFVLSLLCSFLGVRQTWPSSRVELIAFFHDQNYARKTKEAAEDGFVLPTPEVALRAWARFAYVITGRNSGSAIPVDVLLASAEEGEDTRRLVQAGIWCGVLKPSLEEEAEQIRFEHHRFQEYFTALWIHDQEPAISWLDKLDAPRWQETMLNLVLMQGSEDGVRALAAACGAEISQLETATTALEESTSRSLAAAGITYEREAVLADRVELGARLIHGAPNSPGVRETLRPTLRKSLELLVDFGRPVTQVKMMRACRHLDDLDLVEPLEKLLASPVRWVRDQALILVSGAHSGAGLGPVDLQTSMALHLANGQFLTRWLVFVRAGAGARRLRLGFLATTLFALLDLGLLLAAAWGVFELLAFALQAVATTPLTPLVSGMRYISLGRLGLVQALVTGAVTLVSLRRQPASAWTFILTSVPVGVIVTLGCIAMLHGSWEGFMLIFGVLFFVLLAPGMAVIAAPPHLAVVALYAHTSKSRFRFNGTTSLLLRVAARDYREAFGALKSTLRLSALIGPQVLLQLSLLTLALLAMALAPQLSSWLGIPYVRGLSQGLALILFCGGSALVYRLAGRTDMKRLRRLAVEIFLRGLFGMVFGGGLVLLVMRFSQAVAKVLLFGALLVAATLLVRNLYGVASVALARRRARSARRFTPREWITELAGADPRRQERLLLATSPQSLGVETPGEFLSLLVLAESLVDKEPALSAYWRRRDQIEQTIRQERRG